MLITSRETRRWVLPKGNRIRGLANHEAAAHEAFEEAGVSGIACPTPLGQYSYWKRRRNGQVKRATVALFPLAVTEQAEEWPEQDERETSILLIVARIRSRFLDEPEPALPVSAESRHVRHHAQR